MTRTEHLEWCKSRALEHLNKGDIQNAFMSMMSDLRNHQETKNHAGIELGIRLRFNGDLSTVQEMQKFIEDFN